jgi:hypothetical protein
MRRVVVCALGLLIGLSLAGCAGLMPRSPTETYTAQPTESSQASESGQQWGEYSDPRGFWTLAYPTDTWQPDSENEHILRHQVYSCALVLEGWPMGMEGPEAELFEMREKQVPVQLGGYVFQRSILAAKSDAAGYTAEIAYYLSEGDLFAHIVLVAGKELFDRPEELALCQRDAEAVVATLAEG